MRIIDPQTGEPRYQKRRRRYNDANEPRELTFSCFRGYAFLLRDRTREWLRESLENARTKFGFQLWAYVFMPEHVHLLVVPNEASSKNSDPADLDKKMSRFLQAIKEPVGRKAIAHLRTSAPSWLPRLEVKEGQRTRHRFWQPGGGYDRNVTESRTLRAMIDYLHANPVRRGLVARPEDWEWSSARWFAGIRPVKIEMNQEVLVELQRDGLQS